MKQYKATFLFMFSLLLYSCTKTNPNINAKGKDEFKSLELDHDINQAQMNLEDTVYVPIYSDIYIDEQNPESLLAATLSIRNTSFVDSIFISQIDYFNTKGTLVKSFIDNHISIPPMATVNYVIEKKDESGGSGANFIVVLNAKDNNVKPIIQAVVIGEYANKAFSFITNGHSIKR